MVKNKGNKINSEARWKPQEAGEWEEQFRKEFGIHFKDSKGELGFCEEFIAEQKKQSFDEGINKNGEDVRRLMMEIKETRKEAIQECLEIINHSIDKTDAYGEIDKNLHNLLGEKK